MLEDDRQRHSSDIVRSTYAFSYEAILSHAQDENMDLLAITLVQKKLLFLKHTIQWKPIACVIIYNSCCNAKVENDCDIERIELVRTCKTLS